jgi:hypothetical protein
LDIKKRENENYLKYVHAMHLMDEGKSITYIEKNLKMGRNTIKLARKRYLSGGEVALLEPEYSPHHVPSSPPLCPPFHRNSPQNYLFSKTFLIFAY